MAWVRWAKKQSKWITNDAAFSKKKKVDPSTATPCTKITSKLMVWCISVWKPYWTEFSLIAFILLFILFRCPISLMPISLSSLSPSPVTLSKLLMFAPWNTSEYFSMLMYRSHSSTDWNSCWLFTSNLQHKYWTSHLLLGVFVKRSYTI